MVIQIGHEGNRANPLPKFRVEIVKRRGRRVLSSIMAPDWLFLPNLRQTKIAIFGIKCYVDQQCITF